MKILDSNLWIFGLLGKNRKAVQLIERIDDGRTESAMNAYILQEVLERLPYVPGLTGAEVDHIQTTLLRRLPRMKGLIDRPTSAEVHEDLLSNRRENLDVNLIATILDMQAKDVPVLVLGYKHREKRPTVLTNDMAFAGLEPANHNLPAVEIQHIP